MAMDVAARFEQVAGPTQGLATARVLGAAGLPGPVLTRAVRSGTLARVEHGVYARAPLPPPGRWLVTDQGVDPHHVLRVRAALLARAPGHHAVGRTAAVLHGWGLLHEPRRVLELAVHQGTTPARRPGVLVERRRDSPVCLVAPVPGEPLLVSTPLRVALDCLRTLPATEAVVAVDSALRSGAVGLDELRAAAASLPGRQAAARVRRHLGLVDPACGSVLESLQRLAFVRAGLTGFATQQVLCERPHVRVDFCFPAARLVVEVDGARWHPDPARDQRRDNLLVSLGWRVLRFTWSQVVGDQPAVLAQVHAALQVVAAA